MGFKYQKLRGRIIEKFGTIGEFSKKLGTTIQTVSRKLNGDVCFSQKDIISWSELLEIDLDEVGDYFFA